MSHLAALVWRQAGWCAAIEEHSISVMRYRPRKLLSLTVKAPRRCHWWLPRGDIKILFSSSGTIKLVLRVCPNKEDECLFRPILSMCAEQVQRICGRLERVREAPATSSQRPPWRLRIAVISVPRPERVMLYARGESHLSGGDLCCLVCVGTVMARQPRMCWVSQHALWY